MRRTCRSVLERYDIASPAVTEEARMLYRSAPGAKGRNLVLASQETYYPELDLDRTSGCIRDVAHCYSTEGGLAVLLGNIALAGMHREDGGSG